MTRNDDSKQTTVPVTVDKSHIVVIGEKLYAESIELIRELVNNAYDADATIVRVTVTPDAVVVEDDGSGMDYRGLVQYFNIGSPEKRSHAKSPVHQRSRIGMFGIGKFASLAAARRFEVRTQRKGFAACVVFDKELWEASGDEWHLPLTRLEPDPERGDGTTVTLTGMVKSFTPQEVEQRVLSGTPLKAPDFRVLINGVPVTPRSLTGIRMPILEGSAFGAIHGEIVIVPSTAADPLDAGIEIRVKGVLVRRDLFGMEGWGKDAIRVRGEINADFLPVTSDRSGFILDSPEYLDFRRVMGKVMEEVRVRLDHASERREGRRAGKAVKEALQRIHEALARNPGFSPFGPIPYGEPSKGTGGAAAQATEGAKDTEVKPKKEKGAEKKKRKRNPLLKRLTPDAVVKRMRFGRSAVTCVIDHFGPEGPECFSEETVIYLNADHPLYVREAGNPRSFTMHIARLLSQEIALLQSPRNPRKAFELQSGILTEAFRE